MSCDSDTSSTDPCTICINTTGLTTTKPLILEIGNPRPPNIKIYQEKFCSESETESPDIKIIEKKLTPQSKSVEIICSQSNTKPHFKDVTELLKRKHATVKPVPVIPESGSYEYNSINNKSKPVPTPVSQGVEHDVISFDYNNKYTTKNLKQPNTVRREVNKSLPDAKSQAQIENREKFIHEQNRQAVK